MPQPRLSFWQRLRLSLGAAPDITPEQLADANPTQRWRSARALAGSPRPALLPDVLRLLADPDPIVRDEAVRTLAGWGAGYSLKPARDLLASKPSPELAASAFDLLTLLADPDVRPVAARYLTASDPLLRAAAARAFGAAGTAATDSSLASALLPLAADSDPRVRRAACLSLGRIGDASALPALLSALKDGDPSTRQFARQAITRTEAEVARRQKESERIAARQGKKGGETGPPADASQAESLQIDAAVAPSDPSAPAP